MDKAPKKHGGKRPGAGRKSTAHPEGPTIKIGASVPESLVDDLQELCDQRGWNLSQGVTEAIRRLMKTVGARESKHVRFTVPTAKKASTIRSSSAV